MSDPASSSPANDPAAAAIVDGYRALREEVGKFIVGQDEVVEQVVIAMFAGGHCLLEGVPGLAKTMLVKTLSEALSLDFRRIQFTPDLMPADITGTEIIQESAETGKRELKFQSGPIFTQLLLADEINRTPPKTQAALLEAMQEGRVTVGQETFQLDKPFFVLATQNPIEQEGTYPLPEAQKDRFLFQVQVDYPSRDEEREILRRTTTDFEANIQPVLSGEDLIRAQKLIRGVGVADNVTDLVLDLVRATRPNEEGASDYTKEMIDWGAGPRACQHMIMAGKVRAFLRGGTHMTPDDVNALAKPILRHRLVPTFTAEAEGITVDMIVDDLVKELTGKSATATV